MSDKKKAATEERIEVVEKNKDGWFDGKKVVPWKDMTDEHLQSAKLYAQKKELHYHNSYSVFAELVDKIDEEAKKRKITLRDYHSEFHRKTRAYKDKRSKTK